MQWRARPHDTAEETTVVCYANMNTTVEGGGGGHSSPGFSTGICPSRDSCAIVVCRCSLGTVAEASEGVCTVWYQCFIAVNSHACACYPTYPNNCWIFAYSCMTHTTIEFSCLLPPWNNYCEIGTVLLFEFLLQIRVLHCWCIVSVQPYMILLIVVIGEPDCDTSLCSITWDGLTYGFLVFRYCKSIQQPFSPQWRITTT